MLRDLSPSQTPVVLVFFGKSAFIPVRPNRHHFCRNVMRSRRLGKGITQLYQETRRENAVFWARKDMALVMPFFALYNNDKKNCDVIRKNYPLRVVKDIDACAILKRIDSFGEPKSRPRKILVSLRHIKK